MEAVMDKVRLLVNEELMDAQSARIDDLERRIGVLLELLKTDGVCTAMGLHPLQLERAKPSESPLKMRSMRHYNRRNEALEGHRRAEVMDRLARLSPERLDALLRGQ
jgi:hypothetical protein